MQTRTILNFDYIGDLWRVVDAWAKESNVTLSENENKRRLYSVKSIVNAPVWVEIGYTEEGKVFIMGWVQSIRLGAFNISYFSPPEMELRSGGIVGVAPRSAGRKIVNNLLKRLGQEPLP